MPVEVHLPLGAIYGLLLVLARVGGMFVLAPIPGSHSGPTAARIVFAIAVTMSLAPFWPVFGDAPLSPVYLAGLLLLEATLGLGAGLFVAFLLESFIFAAQTFALQAGYAYASTIDPNTDADSGVLTVVAQLFAGLLFFACGFHREIFRVLIGSLQSLPPGGFSISIRNGAAVIAAAGSFITTGLKLALPILALLIMADLSLALLGRIQPQLQLLGLAFPLKMLATLALLALLSGTFARVFRSFGEQLLGQAWSWVGR